MDDIWIKNEDREEALTQLSERIIDVYITQTKVFPLMINDKEKTESYLDQIGAIYQTIQTSIRFSHYRRAARYIVLLDSYIKHSPFGR